MMFRLLAAPPDTSRYMVMGYTVIFLVQAIYFISLWVRHRNLKRDLELLEDLEKKA